MDSVIRMACTGELLAGGKVGEDTCVHSLLLEHAHPGSEKGTWESTSGLAVQRQE